MPVRKGGYWYYTRTVEGQQYGIHCRRAVAAGEVDPPSDRGRQPAAGEEVLLDGNVEAGDSEFFALGTFDVSPDGHLLAYSVDLAGDERFTLRVKDLRTGEVLPDEVSNVFYGSAWSRDGATLFYLTVDEAWRPYRVWRHTVGAPATGDVVVLRGAGRAVLGRRRPEPVRGVHRHRRAQQGDQRGARDPGRRRRTRRRRWSRPAARASSTTWSTTPAATGS